MIVPGACVTKLVNLAAYLPTCRESRSLFVDSNPLSFLTRGLTLTIRCTKTGRQRAASCSGQRLLSFYTRGFFLEQRAQT